MKLFSLMRAKFVLPVLLTCAAFTPAAFSQEVTFFPYIQLGANGTLGPTDQVVIAWQTNETSPNPSAYKVEFSADEHGHGTITPDGRVVDN